MDTEYLVLQSFRSFGQYLKKGTVVNGSQIRSPRLRESEGKIVKAVSSLEVPSVHSPEDDAEGTLKEQQPVLRYNK